MTTEGDTESYPKLTWDIAETRTLIKTLFGRQQLDLASDSLNSIETRKLIAGYHFSEAMRLTDERIAKIASSESPSITHLMEFREDNGVLIATEANALACVQSLHAIADTFTHATYFSLGLNLLPNALGGREITFGKVQGVLKQHHQYATVANLSEAFRKGGRFPYVEALVNHSKHRYIVRASIWADATGKEAEPYYLAFSGFSYDGKNYTSEPVQKFLEDEYSRSMQALIDAGNAINDFLRGAVEAKNPAGA
jgi:hypothetical protein